MLRTKVVEKIKTQILCSNFYFFRKLYRLCDNVEPDKPQMVIKGDQKVSVHLMITIQKATSSVQCPPPVSRRLLTRRTVFSKTVFSIARSTFQMYSVMAILKSSICGDFSNTVTVSCTDFLITLYNTTHALSMLDN